jgi:TolB-like protein/DNA-binding winged helix-turn-helix (wHTH) protein/Tfp pilus assembly protein PilF
MREPIRFGDDLELDVGARRLRYGGRTLKLERIPLEILALLLEHEGEIVSRDEIVATIWGKDVFLDTDNSIRGAIRKIRQVLHDDPDHPRYIQTVTGRGYRFIAPVKMGLPEEKRDLDLAGEQTERTAVAPVGTDSGQAQSRAPRTRLWLALGGLTVLAILTLAYVLSRQRVENVTSAKIRSIAVLPLKNLSNDPAQEYLADGITESLIGTLSSIHDLRVISRTSTTRFKNAQTSVPEIARSLNVDAIVEGSVIREGDRIRVHAQLIRAASDEHFWSATFDRKFSDVLALESDVAQSIAEKVKATVTGNERARLVAARQISPRVYESYLKGVFLLQGSSTRAEIEKSIGYFEEAIRGDAGFAPAYVGMAEAYDGLNTIFVGGSPAELRPKEISAARKALELDPQLADAHALLGGMEQVQWHWAEAEVEYRRALELKPSDVSAHSGLASWLMCQGRTDEALAWARRARELDPFTAWGTQIGWILFQARHYDEAIQELRSVLAVHPDDVSALWTLGFALIGKGQPEQAIPVLERTVSISHRSPGSIELLATAKARAGQHAEALRLINELKQRPQNGYVPAGALINPNLALGEYDEAFAWFERAYQEQSNILQFLKVHPFFDPVRNDPRFKDLVHRVGLD